MTESDILAHWEIFKAWYLKSRNVGYMPSGAALVAAWYDYCTSYNAMLDSQHPLTEPDISDAPDD